MKTIKSILLSLTTLLFAAGLTFAQSNEAHIEQVGSFHEGYIQQDPGNVSYDDSYIGNFPGNGVDGLPNGKAFQYENGASNSSSGSYAEIIQHAESNRALILQAGSHRAQIFQDGMSNIATILQEGGNEGTFSFNPPAEAANPCPPAFAPCDASSDGGSTASIDQEGDRNDAYIEQKDGNNVARIVQYGSDLDAIIGQYGDNNYASILQDFRNSSEIAGYNRSAEIYQENSNNIATVEQYVPTESPILIEQNGTGVPVTITHGTP